MKKWLLSLGTIAATAAPIALTVSCSSNAADSQPVSGAASDKFLTGFFPAWPTMLATVLSLLILIFVLGKFLYKPIKDSVEARKKYIQDNIDESEKQNKDASLDREKANDELMTARLEAANIIAEAKVAAETKRAEIVAAAKDEATGIVTSAKEDIELEKAKFEQDSKQAIIDVALEAAAKVVEKEVDNKSNKKIVEDFIKAKKAE